MKRCSQCKREKDVNQFGKYKRNTDGLNDRCRSCVSAANKRYRDKTPFWYHKYHLWQRYKMTPEEYARKEAEQNNLCAICRRAETRKTRGTSAKLCVDHDHKTGKNRDLLCHACNQVLGQAEDDILRLLAAVDYLKRHAGGGAN